MAYFTVGRTLKLGYLNSEDKGIPGRMGLHQVKGQIVVLIWNGRKDTAIRTDMPMERNKKDRMIKESRRGRR